MAILCSKCGSITRRAKRSLSDKLRFRGQQKRICIGCDHVFFVPADTEKGYTKPARS